MCFVLFNLFIFIHTINAPVVQCCCIPHKEISRTGLKQCEQTILRLIINFMQIIEQMSTHFKHGKPLTISAHMHIYFCGSKKNQYTRGFLQMSLLFK